MIGVIYRIRDKINTKTAWMIYDALIASQLNYCNIVWGYGYKTDLDSLYVLQKRAWRLCLCQGEQIHSYCLKNQISLSMI